MDGTGYLITEIIVALVAATLIGMAAGWLLSTARRSGTAPAPPPAPEPTEPDTTELEAARSELADATAEVERLRHELTQAEWRISTLEDALSDGD